MVLGFRKSRASFLFHVFDASAGQAPLAGRAAAQASGGILGSSGLSCWGVRPPTAAAAGSACPWLGVGWRHPRLCVGLILMFFGTSKCAACGGLSCGAWCHCPRSSMAPSHHPGLEGGRPGVPLAAVPTRTHTDTDTRGSGRCTADKGGFLFALPNRQSRSKAGSPALGRRQSGTLAWPPGTPRLQSSPPVPCSVSPAGRPLRVGVWGRPVLQLAPSLPA